MNQTRIAHIVMTLSLPFFLIALIGCPKAKEQHADLGPEVSDRVVNEAFARAIGDASIESAHVGQYLSYSLLRRIQNSDTTLTVGGTTVNIMAADDDVTRTQTKYTLQINKIYKQQNGSFETLTSEDEFFLDKGLSAFNLTALSASPLPLPLRAKAAEQTQDRPIRVTFHRFSETNEEMPMPEKVKQRADCGGLNPCTLPVHYINFDLVNWFSETDYQKISFNFGFSKKTPFLPFGENFERLTGLLIVDCRATLIPISSTKIYVRDCLQLDDFQK